jgi:hypothetical protein
MIDDRRVFITDHTLFYSKELELYRVKHKDTATKSVAYVQLQFEAKGKQNLQVLVKYKYIELHARCGVYTNFNGPN